MRHVSVQYHSSRMQSVIAPLVVVAMWATTCASSGLAQPSGQPSFSSAAEAGHSLFQAVKQNDAKAINAILGGSTELASSGDDTQDRLERDLFVEKYQEMHRVGREGNGSMVLYIGAENWPFPIPIVQKNGAWCFDGDTGMKEVMFRRIGENELTAIDICHEFVATKRRARVDPNSADRTDDSPTGSVIKTAIESSGGAPVMFQGYSFRVLASGSGDGKSKATKGRKPESFTLIAYPAQYRTSGVMTFVITENDIVYEKDLGADTASLAPAITKFRKDGTWTAVDE